VPCAVLAAPSWRCLGSSAAGAQTPATTDDNRRVILHENGRREYLNPPEGVETVEPVTFGVTRVEPTTPDRPSCTVLSQFRNESSRTIGSAAVGLMFYDVSGNMIADDVVWLGNLAPGHASREERLPVNLHCENFASVSFDVRHCYFVPRGSCEGHVRPAEDTVLPVNF